MGASYPKQELEKRKKVPKNRCGNLLRE